MKSSGGSRRKPNPPYFLFNLTERPELKRIFFKGLKEKARVCPLRNPTRIPP